jgi:hypothetical protein
MTIALGFFRLMVGARCGASQLPWDPAVPTIRARDAVYSTYASMGMRTGLAKPGGITMPVAAKEACPGGGRGGGSGARGMQPLRGHSSCRRGATGTT